MQICKIVYVKQDGETGWRWKSLAQAGKPRVSDETYALFYECVVAARAKGFQPSPPLACS